MGCITDRPINSWNFVTAKEANNVFVSDLSGPIQSCALLLSPPTMSGEVLSSHRVALSWFSNGGEVSFDIYQSIDNINFSVIENLDSSAISIIVNGLLPETEYFFKMKGKGINSVESEFSNTVTLTTDQLEAPSLLTLFDLEIDSINTSWTSNSENTEDEFQLERSLDGISFAQIATTSTGIVTYLDDTPPLQNNTLYFYRVRAERLGFLSEYSNIASASTALLLAPDSLVGSNIDISDLTLDWVSNSGGDEDGFEIQRSLDGLSGWVTAGNVGSGVTNLYRFYIKSKHPVFL